MLLGINDAIALEEAVLADSTRVLGPDRPTITTRPGWSRSQSETAESLVSGR